jgi:isoleucyl-tRNA synthetase
MLRWMAPFLSFTAEEAWQVFGPAEARGESIFRETYWTFPDLGDDSGAALLARWSRIRALRDLVNKEIEVQRAAGALGSSLQANVALTLPAADHALLAGLGDDLKFVLITSKATTREGAGPKVDVQPSPDRRCERCWHWRADVGHDPAHPGLCGRCTSNLFGAGETRRFA